MSIAPKSRYYTVWSGKASLVIRATDAREAIKYACETWAAQGFAQVEISAVVVKATHENVDRSFWS